MYMDFYGIVNQGSDTRVRTQKTHPQKTHTSTLT